MVVEKNEQTKQNLKWKKELNNEVQEDRHHCHCHRLKTLQERVANLQNKVEKKQEAIEKKELEINRLELEVVKDKGLIR